MNLSIKPVYSEMLQILKHFHITMVGIKTELYTQMGLFFPMHFHCSMEFHLSLLSAYLKF